MKLEAFGPFEKKIEDIPFALYGIHSSDTRRMREGGTDLLAHAYASERGREGNQFSGYSTCWDDLGPLHLWKMIQSIRLESIGNWRTYD